VAETAELLNYADPNELNPLYSLGSDYGVLQAQTRFDDLSALLADVQANPGNYPDPEYLTRELNNAIRAQQEALNYAQAQTQYQTLSDTLGSTDDTWYAANAANDYFRNTLGYAGANWTSADQIRSGMVLNGQYYSPDVLRAIWGGVQKAAYDGRLAQRDQLSKLQTAADQQRAKMIENYYIVRPDVTGQGDIMRNYYYGTQYNPDTGQGTLGGQVGQALNTAARSIYAERDRAVKWAGSQLAQTGQLDSGAARKVQQGINTRVLSGLSGVASRADTEAQGRLADWKTTSEDLLSRITDTENATRLAALEGNYGDSLSSYLSTAQNAANKTVGDIYDQAQQKIKENQSSVWGDIGSFLGNVGSIAARTVYSK